MIVPRCERRGCQTPLNPRQGCYCSRACANLGARRLPDADCAHCRKPLTRQQIAERSRGKGKFCSTACSRVGQQRPSTVSHALLAAFRANAHTWLTQAELAAMTYGRRATRLTIQSVNWGLTRLRQRGYRIESCPAQPRPFDWGARRAYRLIEAAQEGAA